jgi:hypothetical protein
LSTGIIERNAARAFASSFWTTARVEMVLAARPAATSNKMKLRSVSRDFLCAISNHHYQAPPGKDTFGEAFEVV